MPPPAAAQEPPSPQIQVSPGGQQICVWKAASAEIRVAGTTVGNVSTDDPCVNLNPDGLDPPPIDLSPDTVVSVWVDGSEVDELIVSTIGIAYVDPAADSARGWAAPGADVLVWFFAVDGDWPPIEVPVTADAEGGWIASSGADLQLDQSRVVARVPDGDGDVTQDDRGVVRPAVFANPGEEWIGLSSFPARETATVSIADGLDQLLLGSFELDDRGDWFSSFEMDGVDLAPGQIVRVEVGTIIKELEVAELTARIDAGADRISGTAPAGSEVWVEIWDHTDWASTPADATTGAWSIDTMAVWGHDLQRQDVGDMRVADEDGDSTFMNWPTPLPGIVVSFHQETYAAGGWTSLSGHELPPNTPIVVEGFDPSTDCGTTDGGGNFWCEVWPQPQVGDTVTVTIGDVVRQLTIRELALDLPTDGGSPSGITEPDTEVGVTLNWDGQTTAWVTSDATRAWISPTQTLSKGDEVEAWVEEPDGDAQSIVRAVPNPRITVEPQVQSVQADDFPPPPAHTGDEPYLATLRVVSPGGATCTLDIQMRNGSGWIEMWSLADPRCPIHPSDTVEVTSEGLTKSVVVEPLEITSVDTAANTIGGVANPGSFVDLSFESWESGWGGSGFAEVHEDGSWMLPEPSSWDSQPWTLSLDDWIQAWVNDEDGDRTLSLFVRPGLSVNPDLDHVWGWGWPDGATIEVNGETWNEPTLCYANMAYWYTFLEPQQGPFEMAPCDGPATGYPAVFLDVGDLGVDILPGDVVTMSDASSTSLTATVASIAVHQVDIATSTITGSSDVPVWMNLFTGLAMGFDGPQFGENWTIDLTTHPYFPGMAPDDRGSFRGSRDGERGETVVRWYAPLVSFEGFSEPVDLGIVNVAKAGKTIPLTFRLTANGEPVLGLEQASVVATVTRCPVDAQADAIETYTKKATGLHDLGDGWYRYDWTTAKSFARSCQVVTIDLGAYGTWPAEPVTFRFTK